MLELTKASLEPTLSSGASHSSISYADALENHRKNTDWWVVFAAFSLPGFQSSPLWIAQKTNLSVDVVVEALEGLTLLGYLNKELGSYITPKGKNFVRLENENRKKADIFEDHALITHQIMNQLKADSLAAIDHRCFVSNVDILNELYIDISAAFEKAYKNSMHAKVKDRILKMSFTAIDVLPGTDQ